MAEVFELLSEQRGERRGQVIRYCLAGYNINLLTSSNKYRANLKNNNKTTRFRARSIVYSFGKLFREFILNFFFFSIIIIKIAYSTTPSNLNFNSNFPISINIRDIYIYIMI